MEQQQPPPPPPAATATGRVSSMDEGRKTVIVPPSSPSGSPREGRVRAQPVRGPRALLRVRLAAARPRRRRAAATARNTLWDGPGAGKRGTAGSGKAGSFFLVLVGDAGVGGAVSARRFCEGGTRSKASKPDESASVLRLRSPSMTVSHDRGGSLPKCFSLYLSPIDVSTGTILGVVLRSNSPYDTQRGSLDRMLHEGLDGP